MTPLEERGKLWLERLKQSQENAKNGSGFVWGQCQPCDGGDE